MKPYFAPVILSFAFLLSCNSNDRPANQTEEAPVALQDNRSSKIYSKRAPSDLLEVLYNELVEKNPELEELENKINSFEDRKIDSLDEFRKYDSKNLSYYGSAKNHYDRIRDSTIKDRMRQLISNSESSYSSKTSAFASLIKQLEEKSLTLEDYHIVLKLSRTLPLIEKYQTDNLPATDPVRSLLHELDLTIKKADSLSKVK